MHWLLYGVTVVIGFAVVALHHFGHSDLLDKKIYYGTFFAINAFSFVFPCMVAAYITTACAGKLFGTDEIDIQFRVAQ